jgi:Lar family restriction alleviation protein
MASDKALLALAELKPCPFCGSKAIVWENYGSWWASCKMQDCHAHGPVRRDNRGGAIEAWNRRALVKAHPEGAEPYVAFGDHPFGCGCAKCKEKRSALPAAPVGRGTFDKAVAEFGKEIEDRSHEIEFTDDAPAAPADIRETVIRIIEGGKSDAGEKADRILALAYHPRPAEEGRS